MLVGLLNSSSLLRHAFLGLFLLYWILMCYNFCDTKMGIARLKIFILMGSLYHVKNQYWSTCVVLNRKTNGKVKYMKTTWISFVEQEIENIVIEAREFIYSYEGQFTFNQTTLQRTILPYSGEQAIYYLFVPPTKFLTKKGPSYTKPV